jgi:putative polyhydroxyalkanoate system protein
VSRLTIRRPHSLERAEAERRLDQIASKMTERFGAVCRREGNVITVEHREVRGTITIEDEAVVIDAKLGLGLSLFRSRAEQEITRILERELKA